MPFTPPIEPARTPLKGKNLTTASDKVSGVLARAASRSHIVSSVSTELANSLLSPMGSELEDGRTELSQADSSALNKAEAKIEETFKRLHLAAGELNAASDELRRSVEKWDSILKALNLGVSAWVEIAGSEADGRFWDRSVGYAELKDGWGLALRERDGPVAGDEHNEKLWPFNQAPRWMRVAGIAKLPDVLAALVKQTEETTKKIQTATERAVAFAKIAEPFQVVEKR